jgi:hypothetical protein
LLQGVILLENEQNYETPLVVSRLAADPFRDNGFYAVFIDLAGLYGGSFPPSSHAIAKLFSSGFYSIFLSYQHIRLDSTLTVGVKMKACPSD